MAEARDLLNAGTLCSIDHLVLPVTTLGLARARLTGLGFTVAPDARHPFGTGNCCVFFENRSYFEPLTIQDRDAADAAAAEGLYFVKQLKRFTERHGEGFAMLALTSGDAEAARQRFDDASLSAGDTFRFSRMATLPDGSDRDIGVALAFARMPEAPDATIFACQHVAPDALFQAQYMDHANTATGIGAVVAVAENPDHFRHLLAVISGDTDIRASPDGIDAAIGRQSVAFVTPAAFRGRYGVEPPDPRRGLIFAGIDIVAADLDRVHEHAGAMATRHEGRIVVPSAPGLGAAMAFAESRNG